MGNQRMIDFSLALYKNIFIQSEKSRVMREYQARFCERLRVELPLSTRQLCIKH